MAVGDYFDIKKCDEKSLTGQKLNNLKSCGKCGDDLQWELYENGQLLIFGHGDMYDYSESDSPWYADRTVIADVEIQESVTGIGTWAFYGLKKLKNLSISQSVSHIGKNAFRGAFDEQCDPVCHVADGFSRMICDEGNWDLISAISYTKIVALFNQCLLEAGYKVPVYHTVSFKADEEAPSIFVAVFYDEQGAYVKKHTLGYHHSLESIDALQGRMVIAVSRRKPVYLIRMYLLAGSFKQIDFEMSLEDFVIRRTS